MPEGVTAGVAGAIATRAARAVGGSFLSYLHLGEWLQQRFASVYAARPPQKFDATGDFWRRLYDGDLAPGSRVQFTDALITDWFPRMPGTAWALRFENGGDTRDTWTLNSEARHRLVIGQLAQGQSGFGVVRLPTAAADEKRYAVLSVSTADSALVDLGIPLVVSRAVYDRFASTRIRQHAVIAPHLDAVLEAGPPPLLNPDLLRSVGAKIEERFLERLTVATRMPSVYLRLESPVGLRLLSNDSSPEGHLWALARVDLDRVGAQPGRSEFSQLLHEAKTSDDFESVFARDVLAPGYAFLVYASSLSSREEIDGFVDAFEPTAAGEFEVLTEFDVSRRRFATAVPPLLADASFAATDAERVAEILADLDRKSR